MAIVCGQNISAAMRCIKEFKRGGALSLEDKDGMQKGETERRKLMWLQELYTQIQFPHSDSLDDPHAFIGAKVCLLFTCFSSEDLVLQLSSSLSLLSLRFVSVSFSQRCMSAGLGRVSHALTNRGQDEDETAQHHGTKSLSSTM